MINLKEVVDWREPILNSDGFFNRPLFHGTSSIFLPSIKKEGLGGVFPFHEKGLELLTKLTDYADQYLGQDDDWQCQKLGIDKMLNQKSEESFNWQHGQVYVCMSRQTACNYATSNFLGSELLTESYQIICLLKNKLKVDNLSPDFLPSWFLDLIDSDPQPVLIEIKGIHIDRLQSEQGEEPFKVISRVNTWRESRVTEFEKVEMARNAVKLDAANNLQGQSTNFIENISIVLAHRGVTKEHFIDDYIEACISQDNFRLISGIVPEEQIVIHYLDKN